MKVGDYARSETYGIIKIEKYYLDGERVHIFSNNNKEYDIAKTIFDNFKSSPNIIDLIEVGDYVNGYLIEKIYDIFETSPSKLKEAHIKYADEDFISQLYDTDIKPIVTREQFESMEYKVEK